jgi:glycosyltransferase involved in cell wall biosynthesis
MRVTIVLATSTGGVGTHVRSLVDRLPGLGIEVAVACPVETERQFGFAAAGAAFQPVPIATGPRPRQDWASVRRLRIALAGQDLVHAHGFRAAALAGLVTGRRRPGRIPLIATWHNAVLASGGRRRMLAGLETLAARRADITLGASSDLVARARELGAPDARLAPVAAPALGPPVRDRAAVRSELGVTADRPVVLAVGRLAGQKDYATLLRAAGSWRQRDPQPLVVVAGDGPELEPLQRVIDAQHLPVRLLGRRDDVPDLLAAADVYVLTSRWEARALVVQEAMAAGLPVVATAVGGVPDLVEDGALLVPAGDAAAVAEEVARLLDEPALRRRLATRATAIAATWPDENETARQVAAVYREFG